MRTGRPRENPIERFFTFIIKVGTCWEWQAALDKDGYGLFWFDSRQRRAHRFSYENFVKKIPDGLVLDHLCRNVKCVNPEHLEVVTNRINIIRGRWKSNNLNTFTHCNRGHKFTDESSIRRKDGKKTCRICKDAYTSEYLLMLRRKNAANPKVRKIKTHCKRGHEFTKENTRVNTTNRRMCITCYENWKQDERKKYAERKSDIK